MGEGASDDLRRELERMRRVVDASHALHSTLDLDALLGLILDAAKAGVHAERGTVFLLTEDGKELWSKVSSGDHDVEIRLPVGHGIAGSVAEAGVTLNLADAYDHPLFDRSWDQKTGFRTRELLTAPIRNRKRDVIGVFQLLNHDNGAFGSEDEAFLEMLSIHAALALENARLHLSALEKERQDREIRLVQRVQRGYQPERLERRGEGFSCAGLNVLCEHASGDYYDFFDLPGGRSVLVVGDVSGHGLGAALVMAQARALMHALVPVAEDLSDLLGRLTRFLAGDMTEGRFISLFVALVDPATGTLQWNNAGHPAALLVRAKTGEVEKLPSQGLVLGVLETFNYGTPEAVHLEVGDVLLIYTDGATEAAGGSADIGEDMFGEEALIRLLQETREREPKQILDAIREALVRWTGSEHFKDDLTLMVLKRTASQGSTENK